jgi:hypothetical protein
MKKLKSDPDVRLERGPTKAVELSQRQEAAIPSS